MSRVLVGTLWMLGVLAGCGGDDRRPRRPAPDVVDTDPPEAPARSLLVRVHDDRLRAVVPGPPIVTIGGLSAEADAVGFARFTGLDPGPLVVGVASPGWSHAWTGVPRNEGLPQAVTVCMQRHATATLHQPEKVGAITEVDSFSLIFQPDAWRFGGGTTPPDAGTPVQVAYTWMEPGSCGVPTPVQSCDDGRSLQLHAVLELAGGTAGGLPLDLAWPAKLRVRAGPSSHLWDADPSAWSWDVDRACWQSTSGVIGPDRTLKFEGEEPALSMEVAREGWWALASPVDEACLEGRLRDPTGRAVPGARVEVVGEGLLGSRIATTDVEGHFCAPVPAGVAPQLSALGTDGTDIYWVDDEAPREIVPTVAGPVCGGNRCASLGDVEAIRSTDRDRDGYWARYGGDCTPVDPSSHPGRDDPLGDGIDANCDGVDGVDRDRDGVPVGEDCDDLDPDVRPRAVADWERWNCGPNQSLPCPCDGKDNDCDGVIDGGTAPLPGCVLDPRPAAAHASGDIESVPCTRQSVADMGPRTFWSMELNGEWIWDDSGHGDDAQVSPADPAYLKLVDGIGDGSTTPWFQGRVEDYVRGEHPAGFPTDAFSVSLWHRASVPNSTIYTAVSRRTNLEAGADSKLVTLGVRAVPRHCEGEACEVLLGRVGGVAAGRFPDSPTPLYRSQVEPNLTNRWEHFGLSYDAASQCGVDGMRNVTVFHDGAVGERGCLSDPEPTCDDCYTCDETGPGGMACRQALDCCYGTVCESPPGDVACYPAILDDKNIPGEHPWSWLGQTVLTWGGARRGYFANTGQVDDLVLFDRALDEAEMELLYRLATCGEGVRCDGRDDDGDGIADEGLLGTTTCPAASCQDIHDSGSSRGDGLYTVDDGILVREVWCDMAEPEFTWFCGDGRVGPNETCDATADNSAPTGCVDCVRHVDTAVTCADARAQLESLGWEHPTGRYHLDLTGHDGVADTTVVCDMDRYEGGWTLLLSHDVRAGVFGPAVAMQNCIFPNPEDPSQCLDCLQGQQCNWVMENSTDTPGDRMYSLLRAMPAFEGSKGYAFLLDYPEVGHQGGRTVHHVWTQFTDPRNLYVQPEAARFNPCGYELPQGDPGPGFQGLWRNQRPNFGHDDCHSYTGLVDNVESLLRGGTYPSGKPAYLVGLYCNDLQDTSYGMRVHGNDIEGDGSTTVVNLWARPFEGCF